MTKGTIPHAKESVERILAAKGIEKSEAEVKSLAAHIFAVGEQGRGVIDFRAFDFDPDAEEANNLAEKLLVLLGEMHHMRKRLKALGVALAEFTNALIDTDQAEFLVRHIETLRNEAQIWGGSELGRYLRECMSDVAVVVEAAEQPVI